MAYNGVPKYLRPLQGKKPTPQLSRYAVGQKRCQVCEIFINWNGRFARAAIIR